jgi:hypothetical protein
VIAGIRVERVKSTFVNIEISPFEVNKNTVSTQLKTITWIYDDGLKINRTLI